LGCGTQANCGCKPRQEYPEGRKLVHSKKSLTVGPDLVRLGNMTRNVSVIFASLLALAIVAGTGCYSTADGRMKPGMPLVKDHFESRYQISTKELLAAAKEVLSRNGTLTLENTINNTLEAKIDGRTVLVKVDEVEPSISRIIVQARTKLSSPDLDLASEIDKQIALQLRR
jgi:hypothetical protein